MPAVESCHCCLALAPSWYSAEYEREWLVLSTPAGEYLGVVCSGCVADEELVSIDIELSLQAA
jgi:hypothetical protein